MIKKITKSNLNYTHMKHVYTVDDEKGEFGFIAEHANLKGVHFKLTEEKYLSVPEVCLICEFMDRLQKIIDGNELDTLRDEYYYNEARPTPSTDTPRK
jgi:hypothetical protein